MTEKALTLKEVANLLGVHYQTIFGKRKEIGFRLPGSRVWRVWPSTLQDLQKSSTRSKVVSLSVRDGDESCPSTSTPKPESTMSTSQSLVQQELDALLAQKTK